MQEALANVRKHADATLVRVELPLNRRRPGAAPSPTMAAGSRPTRWAAAGYGLSSMEQRAAIIGGSLTIDSREQDGTRVLVQMPLAAEGG